MPRTFDQIFFDRLTLDMCRNLPDGDYIQTIMINEIIPKLNAMKLWMVEGPVKYTLHRGDPIFFIDINGQYIVGDFYDNMWHYALCTKEHFDNPSTYIE